MRRTFEPAYAVVVPSLTPDDYNFADLLTLGGAVVVPSLTPDDYNFAPTLSE